MSNLPKGWKILPLEALTASKEGLRRGPFGGALKKSIFTQQGYKVYEQKHAIYKDFQAGAYYIDKDKFQEMKAFQVLGNDFIVSCSGTIGRIARIPLDVEPGVINQALLRIRININVVDSDFFLHQFESDRLQASIIDNSQGGAMSNLVGMDVFRKVQFVVPPLAEQRKIAAILGAWDEAIAAAERLVAALRERKRGLMQRLLITDRETGQPAQRFPGFTASWRLEELGRVFARVTRKNSVRNTNVLTASGEYGLVSQTEYFKRTVAGEKIENYYLLHGGEFAYNRSSSEGYPYGAIKQLKDYDAGILSTLYLCFRLADETADAAFYRHFFEAGGLNQGIYSIAQEGARNHGLLNVGVTDFFGLRIPVPQLAEQQRLAQFFDKVDDEIDLAVQHAVQLRRQKRGLMQRLLTGQVRVL